MNHLPQWSNVYNTVNVTLTNNEFNTVTSKEVSLGKYLDMTSQATLGDVEAELTFEQVIEKA